MKKFNFGTLSLSLFTVIALAACNPTTNPSTEPTNDPTTTVEDPTTSVEDPTTSTPTTTIEPTPVTPEDGVIDGTCPTDTYYDIGSRVYDYKFEALDGYEYSITEALNTKELLVINFFASWCGPCKSEFPAMEEAYRQYSSDVEIYALSCDENDTKQKLTSDFQRKFDITFPIGIDGMQELLRPFLPKGTQTFSIPYTVIVDRYGRFVEKHVGALITANQWIDVFEKYIGEDYYPEYDF